MRKRTIWLAARLVLSGLVGCLSATGFAQKAPATKPTVILFVGNSFLHGKYNPVLNYNAAAITDENYNLPKSNPRHERYAHEPGPWGGIPAIFKKLTDEAGLRYEVHFESISGMPLQFHYDSALAVIQQPRWDAVVLQEYSTNPLPASRGGKPAVFQTYATRLEQAIHRANPAAKIYLYETWARADLTYPAGKPYSGQPIDSMGAALHRGYYQEARQNGHFAGVAPAGDAWLRAMREGVALRNPYQPEPGKPDLWGEDHYHPSSWGAYLNACVVFCEVTGKDVRKLGATEQAAAALGISPQQAVQLQRVAYEQVQAAQKSSNQ